MGLSATESPTTTCVSGKGQQTFQQVRHQSFFDGKIEITAYFCFKKWGARSSTFKICYHNIFSFVKSAL